MSPAWMILGIGLFLLVIIGLLSLYEDEEFEKVDRAHRKKWSDRVEQMRLEQADSKNGKKAS